MRILDFRFNGLVIEPVIQADLKPLGHVHTMDNIKKIGEAKRLALTLDIAIKAMEKKEQEDAHDAIWNLEQKHHEQATVTEQTAQQVSHLKGEYFATYGKHYVKDAT